MLAALIIALVVATTEFNVSVPLNEWPTELLRGLAIALIAAFPLLWLSRPLGICPDQVSGLPQEGRNALIAGGISGVVAGGGALLLAGVHPLDSVVFATGFLLVVASSRMGSALSVLAMRRRRASILVSGASAAITAAAAYTAYLLAVRGVLQTEPEMAGRLVLNIGFAAITATVASVLIDARLTYRETGAEARVGQTASRAAISVLGVFAAALAAPPIIMVLADDQNVEIDPNSSDLRINGTPYSMDPSKTEIRIDNLDFGFGDSINIEIGQPADFSLRARSEEYGDLVLSVADFGHNGSRVENRIDNDPPDGGEIFEEFISKFDLTAEGREGPVQREFCVSPHSSKEYDCWPDQDVAPDNFSPWLAAVGGAFATSAVAAPTPDASASERDLAITISLTRSHNAEEVESARTWLKELSNNRSKTVLNESASSLRDTRFRVMTQDVYRDADETIIPVGTIIKLSDNDYRVMDETAAVQVNDEMAEWAEQLVQFDAEVESTSTPLPAPSCDAIRNSRILIDTNWSVSFPREFCDVVDSADFDELASNYFEGGNTASLSEISPGELVLVVRQTLSMSIGVVAQVTAANEGIVSVRAIRGPEGTPDTALLPSTTFVPISCSGDGDPCNALAEQLFGDDARVFADPALPLPNEPSALFSYESVLANAGIWTRVGSVFETKDAEFENSLFIIADAGPDSGAHHTYAGKGALLQGDRRDGGDSKFTVLYGKVDENIQDDRKLFAQNDAVTYLGPLSEAEAYLEVASVLSAEDDYDYGYFCEFGELASCRAD
ncbi:MAG: hypothetical protein AAGK02_10355 [Pseudomonadota bacterium]